MIDEMVKAGIKHLENPQTLIEPANEISMEPSVWPWVSEQINICAYCREYIATGVHLPNANPRKIEDGVSDWYSFGFNLLELAYQPPHRDDVKCDCCTDAITGEQYIALAIPRPEGL